MFWNGWIHLTMCSVCSITDHLRTVLNWEICSYLESTTQLNNTIHVRWKYGGLVTLCVLV